MTIKNFSIEYDAINSKNTFTNGDTINGRIVLDVSKETKIQSLVFRAKGGANVRWTEHYGQGRTHVYWSEEKYYDVKQPIVRETRQDGSEVIGQGRHVFPFSFNIPDRKMPSSFKGHIGKIVHKLKAELKQSMKLTKKAKSHFTFVSKADMDIPGLMDPQYGCKDTSVKVFGSGNISMDVHTKRMGYKQGEDLLVTVDITNHSSRSVKPKFVLYEKKSFFAQGRRRVSTNDIAKAKIESVASSGKETVTQVISIPRELPPSIVNCAIIKLEYRLKVTLDIKYATDPKLKLPIIVLPAFGVSNMKQQPAASGFGFPPYGNPNLPAWGIAPPPPQQPQPASYQAFGPVPPYGAHEMYPPVKDFGTKY